MPIKLLNAFSLNMVRTGTNIQTCQLTIDKCRALFEKQGMYSCVGHEDTANVISNLLGIPVMFHRVSVELMPKEFAIVAQYKGPRLPEGSTELPKDASIEFVAIYLDNQPDAYFGSGSHILDIIEGA